MDYPYPQGIFAAGLPAFAGIRMSEYQEFLILTALRSIDGRPEITSRIRWISLTSLLLPISFRPRSGAAGVRVLLGVGIAEAAQGAARSRGSSMRQ